MLDKKFIINLAASYHRSKEYNSRTYHICIFFIGHEDLNLVIGEWVHIGYFK